MHDGVLVMFKGMVVCAVQQSKEGQEASWYAEVGPGARANGVSRPGAQPWRREDGGNSLSMCPKGFLEASGKWGEGDRLRVLATWSAITGDTATAGANCVGTEEVQGVGIADVCSAPTSGAGCSAAQVSLEFEGSSGWRRRLRVFIARMECRHEARPQGQRSHLHGSVQDLHSQGAVPALFSMCRM